MYLFLGFGVDYGLSSHASDLLNCPVTHRARHCVAKRQERGCSIKAHFRPLDGSVQVIVRIRYDTLSGRMKI